MTVEPQNRTQFSANGTKGVEITKLETSFAPYRTHGNLPVRSDRVALKNNASKTSNLIFSK